jgi:N6-adenosine-specific RNA methylase IME4
MTLAKQNGALPLEVPALPLSEAEQQEVEAIETTIARDKDAFLRVGEALSKMRDDPRKLYRQYGTFEAYCRDRWGFGKSHVYRLITAQEVIENLKSSPIGELLPANEAQTRELAVLPPDVQREVWQRACALSTGRPLTAGQIRKISAVLQQETGGRNHHTRQLPPPLPSGTFSLILADPPWCYNDCEPSRSPANHYPQMKTEDIAALDVAALAASDCTLLCWATSAMLQEALSVVAAWGFDYKTMAVWVKQGAPGMGYYFRQDHELLLLATRGKPPKPETANRISSVIDSRKGRHSEKPVAAYEVIETLYPDVKRIELFARTRRPGWAAWGNEVSDAPCEAIAAG